MEQWDCHNGSLEVETPQWPGMPGWHWDYGALTLHQVQWNNGTVTMEALKWKPRSGHWPQGTSEMQTWQWNNGTVTMEGLKRKPCSVPTATFRLHQAHANFHENSASPGGGHAKCCEFSGKNGRNPGGDQPEPTQNAANSQRNIAETHKRPRGAHTGAHFKCCKFS